MIHDFDGRVAFVTGGASGIGRAAAIAFAEQKANVFVADVMEDEGRATVAEIVKAGGTADFVRCDVTNSADVKTAIDGIVLRFNRLDFAFNNAGILGPSAHLHEYSDDAFDAVIATHVRGCYLCMKHELIQMRRQGYGSIVNTSSVRGLVGSALQSAYSAAKHAIIGLTKSAAAGAGPAGIRVNAVCPGIIDTPMTRQGFSGDFQARSNRSPNGRAGRSEEIADLVVWLCSDNASLVSGAAIPADGGWIGTPDPVRP